MGSKVIKFNDCDFFCCDSQTLTDLPPGATYNSCEKVSNPLKIPQTEFDSTLAVDSVISKMSKNDNWD